MLRMREECGRMRTEMIEQLPLLLRLLLSCFCGGVIGIERQLRTKVAGTRTHVMIALAASLMMLISKYGFFDVLGVKGATVDVARVAAGIITGIGILGGGLIFIGKQGYVSGITTAAGIWVTVAVGMAIGAGMYEVGIASTVLVILVQTVFHKNLWLFKRATRARVVFVTVQGEGGFDKITQELNEFRVIITQLKWERKENDLCHIRCQVLIPAKYKKEDIVRIFSSMEDVDSFEIIQ